MEALLYILAGFGVVGVAYFLGGKKYAVAAAALVLAAFYFAFGKQSDWTDAWEKADDKLKNEDEDLQDKKEKAKEKRDEIDDKIEDSKDRTEDLKDKEENVEEDVKKPDDSADELKDWVEQF